MVDSNYSDGAAKIQRASLLVGNRLILRDVVEADAEFILSLRTDPEKSAFLSVTKPDVEMQRQWIRKYREGEGQAYFIICDRQLQPLGTVRLYEARDGSFCWGSWIVRDGAPSFASIESALLVYQFAMKHLGFRAAHFEVDRRNISVWGFHERFGAKRVRESDEEFFYEIGPEAIEASLIRYRRFLPHDVVVEW